LPACSRSKRTSRSWPRSSAATPCWARRALGRPTWRCSTSRCRDRTGSPRPQLARELPRTRTLILTTFGRPGYLRRAIESGADGFLLKDAPAEQLADAVREVHAGRRVIDPELAAAAIADGVSPLTEREQDVLAAAARQTTAAGIASELHLSEGTVRNYLSAAIRKLGARNRAEALRIAEEKGWL
jgi:two-component system, NarL family, response regulator DesR